MRKRLIINHFTHLYTLSVSKSQIYVHVKEKSRNWIEVVNYRLGLLFIGFVCFWVSKQNCAADKSKYNVSTSTNKSDSKMLQWHYNIIIGQFNMNSRSTTLHKKMFVLHLQWNVPEVKCMSADTMFLNNKSDKIEMRRNTLQKEKRLHYICISIHSGLLSTFH